MASTAGVIMDVASALEIVSESRKSISESLTL